MSATVYQSCTLAPETPKSESGRPQVMAACLRKSAVPEEVPRLVPKELVHLKDQSGVLVTGWTRPSPEVFLVGAEWPGEPEGPGGARPAAGTAAGLVRQCGLAVSHAAFGVPLEYQSLLKRLNCTLTGPAPEWRDGRTPVTVELNCSQMIRRGGRVIGAEIMEFTVRHEGRVVCRADSRSQWISPQVYRRLRGDHLTVPWGGWDVPEPVAPELVGCSSAEEVALSATGRPDRWLLRNDPANTEMFDHPVDHVPGLALLTAAHQAARAACGPLWTAPTAVSTSFGRYVEFDAPCLLDVRTSGNGVVEVAGSQYGLPAFRIVLSGRLPTG
ncbi:ScbA/BarX family gamma-butyrolactone biosynthesis protein [Streptomyces sp. NPDC001262]|uniref:ScbA/BarX family gamma-butyrolactone biosynthesis protein n=1 Tax=Streptomyces sp. NPDC001262 TaxID=3364552 RepID=UPI0036965F27